MNQLQVMYSGGGVQHANAATAVSGTVPQGIQQSLTASVPSHLEEASSVHMQALHNSTPIKSHVTKDLFNKKDASYPSPVLTAREYQYVIDYIYLTLYVIMCIVTLQNC